MFAEDIDVQRVVTKLGGSKPQLVHPDLTWTDMATPNPQTPKDRSCCTCSTPKRAAAADSSCHRIFWALAGMVLQKHFRTGTAQGGLTPDNEGLSRRGHLKSWAPDVSCFGVSDVACHILWISPPKGRSAKLRQSSQACSVAVPAKGRRALTSCLARDLYHGPFWGPGNRTMPWGTKKDP